VNDSQEIVGYTARNTFKSLLTRWTVPAL
jgi:hypothetical protein